MIRARRNHWALRRIVLVASSSVLLLVGLSGGAGAARSPTAAVTPVDGRLRGQDFTARVTSVAWPAQAVLEGRSVEATTGHRFVVFTLQLAENTNAVSPKGDDPAVTASLRWGQTVQPLSLSGLDETLNQQVDGSAWPSASQEFVASVPAGVHTVALTLSQGSFSQAFNLWSLRRVEPAPTVLYRSPDGPTVSAATSPTGTVSLSNPADGFSSTASVSVQSTTLGYFPPTGAPGPGPASQAVLSVFLDGEFPNNPDDPSGSGHYLGAQTALPGPQLTFTPSGGAPVTATATDIGDTNGKGTDDDGLFDATYSFVVPGNLTTGTLTVNAGTFTGAEFTLYTAEAGTTNLQIVTPITLPFTFPGVPTAATQPTPSWVGAPLPPTASAGSSSTRGTASGSGSGGFPFWLAVLLLVVLAGGVVLVQRLRGARSRAGASAVADAPPTDSAAASAALGSTNEVDTSGMAAAPPAAAPTIDDPSIRVLGPVEVHGWASEPDRGVLEELLCFLVLHGPRPMSGDQIQAALRPLNGALPEVSRKTFHTYLSGLRKAIGPGHLPDANAGGGYQIVGVASDWATFEALAYEADCTEGEEAISHRRGAMALVRGVPFEGVTGGQYEWVFNEQLASAMIAAIARCALRLADDLFEAGDYTGVDDAVRAGLRAAPDDADLWRLGAQALAARQEGRALRRHLADAARHLEPEEMERLTASIGSHIDSDDEDR